MHEAWARPLVLFMFLQAGFVILQSWVGPTFFMPARVSGVSHKGPDILRLTTSA